MAAFLSGSLAGWRAFDRTRFRAMLELLLGAALLAFVPTCLFALGTTESAAWRISTGLLAAFTALHSVVMIRRFRRAATEDSNNLRSGIGVMAFLRGCYGGAVMAGGLGAAGLLPGFGALLLGLLFLLAVAGFSFLRLLTAARVTEAALAEVAASLPHDPSPLGDAARHLARALLDGGLRALPAAPQHAGRLALIVRRLATGARETPREVRLCPTEGVPGDDWSRRPPRKPEAQLAVMRREVAELIANGQPLTLFGDNLFVELDLSAANLPAGTRLQVGEAVVEMTAEPHNGCRKFQQRFGPDALRFVQANETRAQNFRGVYWRVVEPGAARVGDAIRVVARP